MPLNKEQADKLKKIAATASISLALILCLIKGFAVVYTNSLAVLSSMVDSLSDVFASLVTFLAVNISVKPASDNYRYGYGKAEALSALFQAGFVAIAGFFILYDTILRFKNPVTLTQTNIGLLIMIFSLLATSALVIFQNIVAKKTSSQAISADLLHYRIDILTNLSIIFSLATANFWKITWLDPLIAGAISTYLLYNAYKLGLEAINLLLDRELNNNIRLSIFDIIASHPLSPKIHDLRSRDLGGCYLFEFHLELDGNLNLYTAHKYTEEIEFLIKKVYPNSQIIIHQDPVGIEEDRLDNKLTKKA